MREVVRKFCVEKWGKYINFFHFWEGKRNLESEEKKSKFFLEVRKMRARGDSKKVSGRQVC